MDWEKATSYYVNIFVYWRFVIWLTISYLNRWHKSSIRWERKNNILMSYKTKISLAVSKINNAQWGAHLRQSKGWLVNLGFTANSYWHACSSKPKMCWLVPQATSFQLLQSPNFQTLRFSIALAIRYEQWTTSTKIQALHLYWMNPSTYWL